VTGLVNQQLLLENEYQAAENRILKARLQPGWRLSDGERATLAEIGRRLGRKGLQPVAASPNPIPFLAWYRRLVAQKFDGCKKRRSPGRAPVQKSRIWWFAWLARTPAGATTGLWEHRPIWDIRCPTRLSATSCAGMELPPVPERSQTTTWRDFIRRHMDVLAGTDFFTGRSADLARTDDDYVLFFIHLESRRVSIAGITDHPEVCWMRQMACNATFAGMGHLNGCRYLLHDRDAKFCAEFCETEVLQTGLLPDFGVLSALKPPSIGLLE
jgi:hypothetical protein